MNKILVTAAFAAAMLAPSAAIAQAVPPAVIAIVDLDKVTTECNACKSARAALQSQATAIQNREKALAGPLQTEGQAIQKAIDALPQGKEPDAALQARITAFNTKRQQGAQELKRQQDQFERNTNYITQQIRAKLGPVYQQVMQRRGANIMVELDTTLASGAALDVTNDVLAGLNAALPSVATVAPAQAQTPQGR